MERIPIALPHFSDEELEPSVWVYLELMDSAYSG